MNSKFHNLYQIINDFTKLDRSDIVTNTEFDFNYFQTVYNAVSGRFEIVGDQITIDNKKTLGNLYIEEFINDFAEYWNAIDSIVLRRPVDYKIYLAIKRDMITIMRNFSIYKGTEFFIKFVYDLYVTLTVDEFWMDKFELRSNAVIFANFRNLEYNLTGELSSHVWENIIKPTVHPAGWVCNYFGNEYTEYYDIVSYDNHLRNNYCYIDYAGCNAVINANDDIYDFDAINLFWSELTRLNKVNFQFDVLNTGTAIIDEIDSIR
jgi:hypothetical protein